MLLSPTVKQISMICLTGVSTGGANVAVDLGALNRRIVLENDVVFGSVNANRTHYELAAAALARADPQWLARLITRRVPLHSWTESLVPSSEGVKVVVDPTGESTPQETTVGS